MPEQDVAQSARQARNYLHSIAAQAEQLAALPDAALAAYAAELRRLDDAFPGPPEHQ